ncbi:unnamed protein product [Pylaiella littoralis]
MNVTDEQRRRMEDNRAKAKARLREKRTAKTPAASAPSSQDSNNTSGTAECAAPECRKFFDEPDPDGQQEPERPAAGPGRPGGKTSARSSTRAGGGRGGGGGGGGGGATAATNGSSSHSDSRKNRDETAVVCEECADAGDDARVDKELLQGFGVAVCRTCKLKNENYQCVTKKEAKETYLLPEGTIAVLKFIERDNPRHSSWTKMKLYLRRDVAGYSYKRWGNEEGLAAEKHRRDSLKYDRTLARTQGMFKRSRSEKEEDARKKPQSLPNYRCIFLGLLWKC